jgi:hypothetical protein
MNLSKYTTKIAQNINNELKRSKNQGKYSFILNLVCRKSR